MKVTGTMINYFFHCHRQCWLFSNKFNMEDNSENVRIGKILHEIEERKARKGEVSIESVKVDKITEQFLVEFKKSDADVNAAKWQLLYYLKVLKSKGINRRGKLMFAEKNKQTHKVIVYDLSVELEKELESVLQQIEVCVTKDVPELPLKDKKCKKCAYFDYCYI
ncbi:CRISPR-associated protein Cas4 [Sporolactobacillus inulinus]|uniref:CRISPR-associated exonuclease Cas4 n=1 Tax=Sporolactobacillus inulinus CASD TaxID=1069536 RepID=A0A0U1QT35_9BACL|nr:CRISPR-associated protein Cas4 [Sporolactobacillus inulinus]KLI03955.1 CRISPR-associated protein Cas4 [Sporolactobacillus inulinus CASD]GEB77861.1 CRISPR-associated protein Cas4 [Sporolactobacillus inulinus]